MTSTRSIEADYVIVGAGAVAMAFADTLLSETGADIIIIDRRASPGGHWNEAYPFIRLHSSSAYYGVNSMPLGGGLIDEAGRNRGHEELATGAEVCTYFDTLMHERFLPSGRVTWLPLSEYCPDGSVTSRVDGSRRLVRARKKVVDATFADTRTPASHPPAYAIAPGVRCVPPSALAGLSSAAPGYTIIGAGKTAMDAALFLLEQGIDPGAITWVRPRDAWLLNRRKVQVSDDFFADTVGGLAAEMEAARDAASISDLFLRLEAAGIVFRIDRSVMPEMFRCAISAEAEVEAMRGIGNVIRLGRVMALYPDRIELEGGAVPATPQHVYIDCTADGIPQKPAVPIFQPDRIVLQYVRRCSPTFSGAMVAYLEATRGEDAGKNELAGTVPAPDVPGDWLRMHLQTARNNGRWAQTPDMPGWLASARLDGFSGLIARGMAGGDPVRAALLQRYRQARQPGLARMAALLALEA